MISNDCILSDRPIERHPIAPYLPVDAKLLVLGTFPPQKSRWAMDFFYPNPTNDFWKMMGLVFFDNPLRFYDPETRTYRLDDIKRLLDERGIAMSDTAVAVRRLRGTASDKDLEIVETLDLDRLLEEMPDCHNIVTTGEKAAGVIAAITGCEIPAIGTCVETRSPRGRQIVLWRMPSTSRAYPLPLEKKAASYRVVFESLKMI